MKRILFLLSVIAVMLLPMAGVSAASSDFSERVSGMAEITAVRVNSGSDKIRIVVDASKPVRYTTMTLEESGTASSSTSRGLAFCQGQARDCGQQPLCQRHPHRPVQQEYGAPRRREQGRQQQLQDFPADGRHSAGARRARLRQSERQLEGRDRCAGCAAETQHHRQQFGEHDEAHDTCHEPDAGIKACDEACGEAV